MNSIIDFVYSGTQFLYKEIYVNDFFFIDYWTINHIWSGAFLFLILSASKAKYKWTIFPGLILSWEIVEILFRIFALDIFKAEIIKDQIVDFLIGFLAGVLCFAYLNYKSKIKNKSGFTAIAGVSSAFTISFVWLGIQINMQGIGFDYDIFNKLLYFIFTPLLFVSIYLYRKLMSSGYSRITSFTSAFIICAPVTLISCTITNINTSKLSHIFIYPFLTLLAIMFYGYIEKLISKALSNNS